MLTRRSPRRLIERFDALAHLLVPREVARVGVRVGRRARRAAAARPGTARSGSGSAGGTGSLTAAQGATAASPRSARARSGAARSTASSRAAPRCTGCCGCSKICRAGPYSMIRPAYMTITEFAVSATTPRSCVTRMTPMSNSRFTSSISSMICACTVTSSAVVGSSQIRIDGVVHERHRDHRALAHAARELVRVVAGARLRVRDADAVEQLDGARPRRVLADVLVRSHRLGDLRADAVHRVQARERVLEDHRDVLAADVPQLVGRQRQQVAAHELDLAADRRALPVQQAHDREVRDALARAGLADHAQRLAALRART